MCGGKRVQLSDKALSEGWYISPCILSNVTDFMTVAREEIFGPVACVFPFSTDEEVVQRANNTQYGLAAGVFTK